MNQEWSAKNVELQRQIEGRSLGLCEAMQEICEQACRVANAAGVAIALFKADELVYEAGGGTAAACVGRRVMATLSMPAANQAITEILRVEDAEADSRIQSAICHQFGARALLIQSFCNDRRLSGILQVSFDQPHAFLETEVEAYRTLAGLAQTVLTVSSRPERARVEPAAPSRLALIPEAPPVPFANESAIPWSRTVLSTFSRACDIGIAAIIVVASIGLTLTPERATVSRLSLEAASPGPVTQKAPPASLAVSQPLPNRLGSNATMPLARLRIHQHTAHSTDQVRYIGDDVTVRYFAPKTAVVRSRDEIQVRRVLDDVTVRYFPSTSAQQH
jgi:hypothetical protein